MAAATPDGFNSRAWRVEGIPTKAQKNGTGKWALVMKYRTSATHTKTFAPTPFRSSDAKYDRLWDTKEEAMQQENLERFRDFVQVLAVSHSARGRAVREAAPRPRPRRA